MNIFHDSTPSEVVITGMKAVPTGTAEALPSVAIGEMVLKAGDDNAVKVYIGAAGTTLPGGLQPGFELGPGQAVPITVKNLNVWYVIAAATGANVFWIGKRK